MSAADMSIERLEALLRGDEPRTLEEKNRSSLLAELRAGTLEAPGSLRERVLATSPAARRAARVPRSRRRRLTLVVVPVAVALAVGAAVIHGVLNSSPNRALLAGAPAPSNPAIVAHRTTGDSAKTDHVLHGTAGKRLVPGTPGYKRFGQELSQTQSKAHTTASGSIGAYKAAPGKTTQHDDLFSALGKQANKPVTGAAYALAPNVIRGRLVHADVNLEVRVGTSAGLSRATTRATQIVASLGGYAQSVQYASSRNGGGSSFLDLRVPVTKAETAMGRLAGLGTLVSQQVQTQSLQQAFTHQTNQIGSLKRAITVYQQALSSGSVSGSQRVEVEVRLSNAEHSLNALRKSRSHTLASAATTDITLTLTTNRHAGVIGHRPSKPGRLGRMLGSAGRFLGLEGIIVLYALVVLSPFLVLGGLVWWVRRERRRRDEQRLLATT